MEAGKSLSDPSTCAQVIGRVGRVIPLGRLKFEWWRDRKTECLVHYVVWVYYIIVSSHSFMVLIFCLFTIHRGEDAYEGLAPQ